jgi:CubicO group peptidase (beta-lactamase class C family)
MTLVARISADSDTGVSADNDTVVPWWSFTKTLIAATALAMVRDGDLVLDEELPGRDFTLRHLLQHRAGVADYGALTDYQAAVAREDDPWPVDVLLRNAGADRRRFKPGSGWEYSNTGYLLARQHLERVAGMALGPLLRKRLFEPLGVVCARIADRRRDLDGVMMIDCRSYDPRWVYHGLAVGPLRDAAGILHRLMTTDFLPWALRAEMSDGWHVENAGEGRPWLKASYGLGTMVGVSENGLSVVGHSGGGPGSTIAVYHVLDSRTSVAAFAAGTEMGATETRAFGL